MIEICRSGTSICDPVLEGKGAVVDALDSHELYETEAAGAQSFDHVQVLQLGVLHQIVNDAFRFIRHLKINPFFTDFHSTGFCQELGALGVMFVQQVHIKDQNKILSPLNFASLNFVSLFLSSGNEIKLRRRGFSVF